MRRSLSRLRWQALLLVVTLVMEIPALAQEFQPYPTPRITVEQWSRYLEAVKANLGSTAEILPEKNVVVFVDMSSRTHYIFTTKDHPAHPAWITRRIVEEGGQVNVRQIGFFAGPEEQFAALFREYQKMNERLRDDVQRRNQ